MYERLLAANRFGRRPPEFLLTHPLTESRISDSRARASRYPHRDYAPSLNYQIIRARVIGHYAQDKAALIIDLERNLEDSTNSFNEEVNRYSLAVAYWENGQYAEADRTLAPLLAKYPNLISLVVTQAEIYTKQNEAGRAIQYLERHLEINPGNHPLAMAHVDALLASRSYNAAAKDHGATHKKPGKRSSFVVPTCRNMGTGRQHQQSSPSPRRVFHVDFRFSQCPSTTAVRPAN